MGQCFSTISEAGFVCRSLFEWLRDFFPNRHTLWRDIMVDGDYEDCSS